MTITATLSDVKLVNNTMRCTVQAILMNINEIIMTCVGQGYPATRSHRRFSRGLFGSSSADHTSLLSRWQGVPSRHAQVSRDDVILFPPSPSQSGIEFRSRN